MLSKQHIHKKLNNNISDNEEDNITNKEISELSNEKESYEKDKIELSNNVSNKEALKDKIHEIHNYLRNNGAGYGMNALKVFNLLYGLKKIEEKKLLDKVNLKRPDCEFSYLLKIANENKEEQLTELILNSVTTSIYHSNISELLFYEIPSNIKSYVLAHLIKEIEKITVIEKTCNVLLSGKIYEYFIGRDESAISELGAYFTDRHIVDYIYTKLDPEINDDGTINSMIDMFGGSGGFTTGYINYLNNKYDVINWKDNINKVYHFDMNEDVIKSAGLEFFCLTGILPNMNDNLIYKNSFTDEFNNKKFMNVITNPPYGGDKTVQSDAQIKRKKIKEYIKKELLTLKDEQKIKTKLIQIKKIEDQEKQDKKDSNKTKVSIEMCSQRIIKYAKDNKLTGNDKESSSLILIMDMVDVNGTAIGVLKEGVFFNKTYKDIRKCLVENFNVREVISVPSDQFENTSTKTSIIIFDNTEDKTNNVKFYDLVVERYDEDKFEEIRDEIILTNNKGDISGISDKLISEATKQEILDNAICSLNAKDYNKKVTVCGKDYELIKIGDICEFKQKSKKKASDGKQEGKYNFYTSSDKVQKCDEADYKDECLIIGTGGIANIKIDKEFSCSADNHIIKTKYNKYIYYLIISNMNILIDGFTGSVLKHLSKEYLVNLQIPIPKSEQKIIEWVKKISKPYDEKNSKQNKIKELDEYIQNKIKDINENEDCEEVELGSCCEINYGTRITKNNNIIGNIPVYGGGDITFYTNTSNRSKNTLIVSRYALSKCCIRLISTDFFLNDSGMSIKVNNTNLQKYFNNYLLSKRMQDYIYNNCTSGSIQRNININLFKKIKIFIPKNKQLIKDFEPTFDEIEKLLGEVKEAEMLYIQLLKELSDEAILKL